MTSEEARLQALDQYQIMDTDAEREFDALTKLASFICQTPISLISLVDKRRQWFKSRVGLDVGETPREISFCAHAIRGEGIFEVRNALEDERFSDNPLVTDQPNIRFYAGSPLVNSLGFKLGTLCVIDTVPRELTDEQKDALKTLADEVIARFEMRLQAKQLEMERKAFEEANRMLDLRNRELIELNTQKNNIISIVSHDLRNPVSQIIGLVRLIKSDADNLTAEQIEDLDMISDVSWKTGAMINQMLNIQTLEDTALNVKIDATNLTEIIRQQIHIFKELAERKDISIHANIEGRYCALVDGQIFAQILENLLSNAVKFSPPGKNIYFDVYETEGVVGISIRDEGPGFTSEDQAKLYGKFQKLSARPTGGESSTGIGLSLVKKYVESMNGVIWCETKSGAGTTFMVEFIAAPQEEAC